MSSTTFTLLAIGYYILAVTLVILVLNFISKKEKKVYKDEINSLERDKNLIISASILSELNKVESLVNNEKMEQTYQDWQKRFKKIKDEEVPKISDDLLEIEDLFQEKNYKTLKQKIAQIELQIYYVKTRANFLLEEIKEITLSEEKNRETITKLKIIYREIFSKYNQNKSDYKLIASPIELQFENVDKLFSAFEIAMDEGSFSEVGKIVKAIDDTIGNLKLIIEEAPSIIMMGKTIIPKNAMYVELDPYDKRYSLMPIKYLDQDGTIEYGFIMRKFGTSEFDIEMPKEWQENIYTYDFQRNFDTYCVSDDENDLVYASRVSINNHSCSIHRLRYDAKVYNSSFDLRDTIPAGTKVAINVSETGATHNEILALYQIEFNGQWINPLPENESGGAFIDYMLEVGCMPNDRLFGKV